MYVLSISSLSEVEMVQKRAEINHDVMADDDDWCRLYVSVQWLYCVASMEGALVRPGQAPSRHAAATTSPVLSRVARRNVAINFAYSV